MQAILVTRDNDEREILNLDLLQAGADLVLSRPVAPRVLAQYTRTLLRRAGGVPSFVLPEWFDTCLHTLSIHFEQNDPKLAWKRDPTNRND